MPAHELVNPNLHVVLVHFPIGLLIVGTLIELFSFLGWRTSGFRVGGRWMILLGALLAVPTAFSGIYALSDVVRMQTHADHDATWHQTLAASPVASDAQAWAMLQRHAFLNGGVVVLLGFVIVVWLSGSDAWRRRMHLPLTLLLVIAVGATVLSAWYGGEVVYRRGVGVMEGQAKAAVSPQAAPTGGSKTEEKLERATTNPAALSPTTAASETAPSADTGDHSIASEEQKDVKRSIERALPPMQMHVILAGFAVAAALAALGLSLRAANVARAVLIEPVDELSDLAVHYGAKPVRPGRPDVYEPVAGSAAQIEVVDRTRVPSARFWLLTALFALLTAALGWYLLTAHEGVQNAFDIAGVWNGQIKIFPRRMFHVICGVSILALSLLLSIIAAVAPRNRGLIFIVSLLLIAAVAAQVWLGILMLWDTHEGGIRAFNA